MQPHQLAKDIPADGPEKFTLSFDFWGREPEAIVLGKLYAVGRIAPSRTCCVLYGYA